MSSANTNTAISVLVSSQLPAFVRDDNPLFASFLEAYYEYLEQKVPGIVDTGATGKGRVIEKLKNLATYRNLNSTLSDFKYQLYSQFLQLFPTGANTAFTSTGNVVDFDKILPKIKDFYRARGTEKSYKFVMRVLTGGDAGSDTTLYYPKDNILRASDGKWFIQRSIRVANTQLNGTLDPSSATFNLFVSKKIKGLQSNTTAIVDRVEQFFELGTLVNEIFLSSISNTFISGETVRSNTVNSTGHFVDLKANIFSGIVSSISVGAGGQGYLIGDPVIVTGGGGSGATAVVSDVTKGNIETISVISGGSGYRSDISASPDSGDFLLFSGGGGTGANANVYTVLANSYFHPNSYNIVAHSNTLAYIAGANWRAAQTIWSVTTSNLAQNSINSLGQTFRFQNTGPVSVVTVRQGGTDYTSLPSISVIANSQISSLGILGSLIIKNPGTGYSVGDRLIFSNPFGGWGTGANANVVAVNVSGSITQVAYRPDGDIRAVPGGTGYETGFLPTITVSSAGGTGAQIEVDSILGSGARFSPDTGRIGSVTAIAVTSGGAGYETAPDLDLTGSGDGTATALASVVRGTFTYPGYFLNQDGMPSSFNFLQDRDYYQNYSYVLRAAKISFSTWVQSILNLVHPSGLKVFGEYLVINDIPAKIQSPNSNSVTGSFGYDSIRAFYASAEGNSIYFPGNTFIWSKDGFTESVTGTSNTRAALGSFWFKLDSDAPALINVGGPEMTIFELAGGPPTYNAAHKVFIGKTKDPSGTNYIPWSSNIEVFGANTWILTNLNIEKDSIRVSIPTANGGSYNLPLDKIKSTTGITDQYYIRHYFGGQAPFPNPGNTFFDLGNKQAIYSFYAKSGISANNRLLGVRVLHGMPAVGGTVWYCNTANGGIYASQSTIASGAGYAYANVSNIGNGVYRYAFFTNPGANTTSTIFDVMKLSNNHPTNVNQLYGYPVTESANDGIILGGFQIEPGNTAPSIHVPTLGANTESIPKYAYADTSLESMFVGFRFKNVITGATQAEFRTDYRKHPIIANNWYHVLISANICSNGIYHDAPHNQGIFLNNIHSQIIVQTTGAWPSGQSANLAGVQHASFGGNTYLNNPTIDTSLRTLGKDSSRGGLKFKGYISDFFWSPYTTINANPEIASIRPQVYQHLNAFFVSNTISSNIMGLGPQFSGSNPNVANIGILLSSGSMLKIAPKYFFRGTTGVGKAGLLSGVPTPSANLANLNSGNASFSGSYHTATGNTLQFVDGQTIQEPVEINPFVPKGMNPGPGKEY